MKLTAETLYLVASIASYLTAILYIITGNLAISVVYLGLGSTMLVFYLQSKDKK